MAGEEALSFLLVTADHKEYGLECSEFDVALSHCSPGWYIVDTRLCELWPAAYIDYHWKAIAGLKAQGYNVSKFEQEHFKRFRINNG